MTPGIELVQDRPLIKTNGQPLVRCEEPSIELVDESWWRRRRRSGGAYSYGYGYPSGGRSQFIPSQLPNLSLWLEGDAGNIVFNGPNVRRWNSIAPATYFVEQNIAADQPLWNAGYANLNGKPAVEFNGVNQWLFGSAAISTIITVNTYTMFAAFDIRAITTNNAAGYDNDQLFADGLGFTYTPFRTLPEVGSGNFSGVDNSVYQPVATGAGQIVTAGHGGGNEFVRVETAVASTIAAPATTNVAALAQLGANWSRVFFTDIVIGALIVYSDFKSTAEQNLVIGYLKGKYG